MKKDIGWLIKSNSDNSICPCKYVRIIWRIIKSSNKQTELILEKLYSEMNENVKAGQRMIYKDIFLHFHPIKEEKESFSIKLLSI